MRQGKTISTWLTKSGKFARLRVIRKSDFENLLSFANRLVDEDTFIMLSGNHLTRAEERTYLADTLKKVAVDEKIHLIVEVGGVLAGSCEIRRFGRRKRHVGEIGISILPEYRNDGIGFICMTALIEQARRIGLRLLYLHLMENNERAFHLYEKVGFRRAGVVPGMYAFKGGFVGEVTMYLPLSA